MIIHLFFGYTEGDKGQDCSKKKKQIRVYIFAENTIRNGVSLKTNLTIDMVH